MNFELGPDENDLISAAREALSRTDTLALARSALDGGPPADLWPTAVKAGWTDMPGLLHNVLVLIECGRSLAPTGLLGHLTVTTALRPHAADPTVAALLPSLLDGTRRAAIAFAHPSSGSAPGAMPVVFGERNESVAGATGALRPPARQLVPGEETVPGGSSEGGVFVGEGIGSVAGATDSLRVPVAGAAVGSGVQAGGGLAGGGGELAGGGRAGGGRAGGGLAGVAGVAEFVPDVVGADVVLVGTVDGLFVAEGMTVTAVGEYDRSRPTGKVSWEGGTAITGEAGYAWDVAQTLLAAEALGASEAALTMAVAYAKERKAFGRAIGSFQAIKHQLTDALRLNENARSLLYYAAYAAENQPDEFGLAANAARFAADQAIEITTRRCLAVHGGLGATWEHDAHLYFRRAQLTRLLLGGQAGAGERVVQHVVPG